MKKITQVADTGGGPITKADLRVVFNLEIWDVLEAMFEGYDTDTQGIIVSGCELSGSVGNYTISAGIVYLDGEFRRFAAQTGLSLPQYIKAATDTNDSRTFEDASSKVLFITESADLATSAPGTQYVPFTSTTSADGRRFNRPLTSTVTKKSKQINMNADCVVFPPERWTERIVQYSEFILTFIFYSKPSTVIRCGVEVSAVKYSPGYPVDSYT